MPKVRNRRVDKARELIRLARNGPASLRRDPNWPFEDDPEKAYKLWSESWLIPLILELVPELKKNPSLDPGREPSHQSQ